jgi:hypothetical protein
MFDDTINSRYSFSNTKRVWSYKKFVYYELNDMNDAENMIFFMISFDFDIF